MSFFPTCQSQLSLANIPFSRHETPWNLRFRVIPANT